MSRQVARSRRDDDTWAASPGGVDHVAVEAPCAVELVLPQLEGGVGSARADDVDHQREHRVGTIPVVDAGLEAGGGGGASVASTASLDDEITSGSGDRSAAIGPAGVDAAAPQPTIDRIEPPTPA